MKKAEWQAVYAPQGDALEKRVRTTLDGLADRPERAYPRRAVFVAAALVLALIAAAAVAAGLLFHLHGGGEGRADRRHLSRQQRCGRFCVEAGRLHRYDSERSG